MASEGRERWRGRRESGTKRDGAPQHDRMTDRLTDEQRGRTGREAD